VLIEKTSAMTGPILSPREIRRYSRQMMLPGFGPEGQEKLKMSGVLVIGAGGLGCPVLQYLAAAGIGRIAIADDQIVDETNLQRQILYGSQDLGKLKSIIAKGRLDNLNSLIETNVVNLRIQPSNALRILQDFDIIVDATDNLRSRYIINDACVILRKPMVHGAVFRFEGQVSVFNYKNGPTYRCFNPQDPVSELIKVPSDSVGLPGVLAGITGTLMANEVLKIVTGTGEILSGRMLIFNIMDYSFNILKIRNIPENHHITEMREYY
jgi:molybdopterin/thiamine biosynthesis adenylyltransferase